METKHLPRAWWLNIVARTVGKKRLSPATLQLLETGRVAIIADGVSYTTDPVDIKNSETKGL